MDGCLRHTAGFLSGGGDTPSPTPTPETTFFLREVAEGQGKLLVNEDGAIIAGFENIGDVDPEWTPYELLESAERLAWLSDDASTLLTDGFSGMPWYSLGETIATTWGVVAIPCHSADTGIVFTTDGVSVLADNVTNDFDPELSDWSE